MLIEHDGVVSSNTQKRSKSLEGVMLFLFDGTTATNYLIGQKLIRLDELLDEKDLLQEALGDDGGDIALSSERLQSFFLNDDISVEVTVFNVEDLVIPTHANPGGIYFRYF